VALPVTRLRARPARESASEDTPPVDAGPSPGRAPEHRRTASRTLVVALAQLAVAVVALGLVQIALVLSLPAGAPYWALCCFAIGAWIYLAAGIVAWLRRPTNRLGAIMVAAGLAWLAAGFANAPPPALIAGGLILATLPLAMGFHLLHAFPSGRLHGTTSRLTVMAGYALCLAVQAPQYLFVGGPDSPWTVLRLAARPGIVDAAEWTQWAIGGVLVAVTVVILASRLHAAAPAQRRVLAPLFLYGIVAVLYVPFSSRTRGLFPDVETAVVVQMAVLAGVPVAFAVGLLRGGFARTGELQELAAWLRTDRSRPALAGALADALGDPSLELVLTPDEVPATGSGRASVDVMLGGQRVGAIHYDATLTADRETVESAGRVVALALRNEQLTAELRAGRDRLQRALARTVEASDAERRRIARDLHDGLQGRLVLLAIQADGVRSDPALADDLGEGLQTAITELRGLVQGVMPAMLTERGLCAAVEELTERSPIPVVLDLDRAREPLPGAVESAGYFIVAEALANAIKHAQASAVDLRMAHADGELRIEMSDDGVGGAHADGGSGLRGMADRVDALDGRLVVSSPRGGGTFILAELPCGS
jgi:signal transduction histidine kinase